jgi:lipopolysaccharide transport system ATP-binding protein
MSSEMVDARDTSAPLVRVSHVSKSYQRGELSSLRRTINSLLRRARILGAEGFTALDDISFEISGGSALGLVGHNGSGKSTLLHTVCGITLPTAGSIDVRGLVMPLFAIGTSFHPELTGRENIILFGAILGLSPAAVEPQTDTIAAFAELEDHLDTPVKRYSDGMKARLSFAIAMRFPADIYIFDEVLAVVDTAFRDRCLREIEILRDAGKLVLFVSHDVTQVQRVTTHTLWLEHGRVRAFGPSEHVLTEYEKDRAEHNARLLAAESALV